MGFVNIAAMNIGIHVSFWIMVFSGYRPSCEIAGSHNSCISSFLRNLHNAPHSGCIKLQSYQHCKGVAFSPHSLAFIVCVFFDHGHSDWCEVISYCSFDQHLSNSDADHLFTCLLAICMSSLKKCLFRSSAPFSIGLFFVVELYELFIYFGN